MRFRLFTLVASALIITTAFAQKPSINDINDQFRWVNLSAIRASLDDMRKMPGFNAAPYEKMYTELSQSYNAAAQALQKGETTPAERVILLKRQILLANPLLDIDKIVVARYHLGERARKAMCGDLGAPPANYSSIYSGKRTGQDCEIVELSNLRGEINERIIYKPQRKVNIADLQMHWNADKLLFTSLDENNKWQIYEVGTDGKDFTQKVRVNEPDLEFCDATYLPDGRIIASSNIGYNGVPCVNGQDVVGNLSLYNPKDGSFRRLNFDQDGNWNPTVIQSGRVMYTRWEYTDLTHYFSRMVMNMNPDGTENKALYGSGSYWPNSIFDMRQMPNFPTQFIGIVSGHHGVSHSGRLIIFDIAKGRKEAQGVVQEVPFSTRTVVPEIKDYLVNGVYPQFARPNILNDNYFLVAAKLSAKSLWGIYLADRFDNLTLIAEFDGAGLNAPLPVRRLPIPPVVPDRVNLTDKQATVFIQDIYEGEGTRGVPRGTVKQLRVFAYEYAYLASPSDHDAQGVQSGWDIKRLLGTVPVEDDGSALFKVPAGTPISLQPLDKDGAAIQWFRSWFTAQPGETVSCIGCHEDQSQVPIPKRVMASKIKPHRLTPPKGGARPFTFPLEIQPILDRACLACHNGSDASRPDLRGGQYETMRRGVVTKMVRPWAKSYLALHPYVYRQGPEADIYVLQPYEYHASNSELVRMLKQGHHNVSLTDSEWRTLYNWIDFNAPYSGSFDDIRAIKGCTDQYSRRMELMEKYNGIRVDWRKEISDYAAELKAQGTITPAKPTSPKSKSAAAKSTIKPAKVGQAKAPQTIEVAPGISMKFVWIPDGEFTMGSNSGNKDCAPAFRAKIKKGFWMSECEVSNEQFQVIFPEHDSRYIGQLWKDHTTPGYAVNKPKQPVVRITWEEAQEFCRLLGEKLEKQATLPTETEWEWACRAATTTPFWYGEGGTDYSKFENMADAQLSKMAVIGVDPKPMKANDPLRKFWDYMLRDSGVDDSAMISTAIGSYMANPWGLKDIHGNVAEWTASDYVPYPLRGKAESQQKVVRGGAWSDRAQNNTSYSRRPYLPWQRPYNVGFRVVLR